MSAVQQPQFGSLREKIAADAKARNERYVQFATIFAAAVIAGRGAATEHRPTPMQIVQRENPLDDASAIVKRYEPVADGVCGFAWVTVRPGSGSFAKWLVKEGHARKAYHGGVDIWVSDYNQSMEKKEAHASAMAKYLRDNAQFLGTDRIYSDSRMD